MSKQKKTRRPAKPAPQTAKSAAPSAPAEKPEVSPAARWMGALCYLSVLILIPACSRYRHDPFVRFHLNQGLVILMLATVCGALGLVSALAEISVTLTLLVDVLSLVGLVTALRRRAAPLPFVGQLAARFHPFR